MTWIIIEGIDRSGKSSVAEHYKKQGYLVHHMSAPSKKYTQPGYTGPSYADDCMELYLSLDGKNVVFDRSIYGERVWPDVYGRKHQLDSDDFEVLKEIEANNETQYILMHDSDFEAHWNRCQRDSEPLNRNQFNMAVALYEKVATAHSFNKMQLSEFSIEVDESEEVKQEKEVEKCKVKEKKQYQKSVHQIKLDEANAINDILSSKILKKKDEIYIDIENGIRDYLNTRLSNIFGQSDKNISFTKEEVLVLKTYVDRLKQRMNDGK